MCEEVSVGGDGVGRDHEKGKLNIYRSLMGTLFCQTPDSSQTNFKQISKINGCHELTH
jgi:hypothetical protein